MQTAFLPRTSLSPDETRINFTIVDNAVMKLLTSSEAEQACSKIWLIYSRLKQAEWRLWERSNVLYVGGDDQHTAWEFLCELAGVASATLRKALKWMAEQKVIGYFARKNGAGIRIYFNLAVNSVRPKQKNLHLVATSSGDAPASANEAPSWEDKVFPKNIQDSDLDASREPDTPTAEKPSDVVAAPIAGADIAAPVAPAKPTLQLVPPVQAPSNVALQIGVVEALARNVEQLAQEVRAGLRALPSKDFMLNQVAGKAGRTAADTTLRIVEKKKANNAYVGAAPLTPPDVPSPSVTLPAYTEFWQGVLPHIAARVNAQSFETWFAPLNAQQRDGCAVIVAPDQVFAEWIEANYAEVLDDVGLTERKWDSQLPPKKQTTSSRAQRKGQPDEPQ